MGSQSKIAWIFYCLLCVGIVILFATEETMLLLKHNGKTDTRSKFFLFIITENIFNFQILPTTVSTTVPFFSYRLTGNFLITRIQLEIFIF